MSTLSSYPGGTGSGAVLTKFVAPDPAARLITPRAGASTATGQQDIVQLFDDLDLGVIQVINLEVEIGVVDIGLTHIASLSYELLLSTWMSPTCESCHRS
jgi:hypothetical protein